MSWVDDAIDEGNRALSKKNFDGNRAYLKRTVGLMAEDVPTVKMGLHMFKARFMYGSGPAKPIYTKEESVEDINTVLAKLNRLKFRIEGEVREMPQSITINNSNVNSPTNHINITFTEARKQIDMLDSLTTEEKARLKEMLVDIEESDDETLGDKVMRAIKFVGGKTFEVSKVVIKAIALRLLGM